LPLNGAAQSVLCSHCTQILKTPPEFWQKVLGADLPDGVGLKEGKKQDHPHKLKSYAHEVKVRVRRESPRCSNPQCNKPLPDSLFDAGFAGQTEFQCPACATAVPVRQAPDWFRTVHPTVRLLVSEQFAGGERQEGTESIPFHCNHCGGSLAVDGAARQVHCQYCGNQSLIPDEIWSRLHPANEVSAWYVVLDMGNGVGLLPQRLATMTGVAGGRDNQLVVAFLPHTSNRYSIAKVDGDGRMLWVYHGIPVEMGIYLFVSPHDGTVFVLTPDDTSRATIYVLHPDTGEVVRKLKAGDLLGEDLYFFDSNSNAFALDLDGTFVIKREWPDGGSRRSLRRFDAEGNQVDLWPQAEVKSTKGFFSFLSKKITAPKKPGKLDKHDQVRIGWDGHLYVFSPDHWKLTWCDREGNLVGETSLRHDVIGDVIDFGVTENGTAYFLFKDAVDDAEEHYNHIARLLPGGEPEIWVGPLAKQNSYFIGWHVTRLSVSPSGLVHVSSDGDDDRMRTIDADGVQVWRPPATRREDAEAERMMAEK